MDSRGNRKEIALLVAILFLALPGRLLASELTDFLWKTFNFSVLLGILIYYLGKPIKEAFLNYSSSVRNRLKEAEERAREAEEKLREAEERLSNLTKEIEELKSRALDNAEKEREKILKEAEEEAEKIRRIAQEEMEAYFERAKRELRAYAAELAVQMAKERIKKKMTPELQKRLMEKYIEELEN